MLATGMQWVEAEDAANILQGTCQPQNKNHPVQNVSGTQIEKPGFREACATGQSCPNFGARIHGSESQLYCVLSYAFRNLLVPRFPICSRRLGIIDPLPHSL